MKTFKLRLSFFKYDIPISILMLLSFIGIIKTSGENDSLRLIIFNISVGILVSAIFYIFNIFLPKLENFNNNMKAVKWNINVIHEQLCKICMMILGEHDVEKIRLYSENDVLSRIAEVDPDSEFEIKNAWGSTSSKINNAIDLCYQTICIHISYLINLHDILPYELFSLILQISAPKIKLDMSIIKKSNKENFENFKNVLIPLFKCYIELNDYKKAFKI